MTLLVAKLSRMALIRKAVAETNAAEKSPVIELNPKLLSRKQSLSRRGSLYGVEIASSC